MRDETTLAFEHPEERARALAPDVPHDRISLRDHIVEVEIGAFQPERGRSQRVCFDVVVEVRPHDPDLGDDVDRILSYDTITEAIAAALAEERLNLLETLADRVAARILAEPLALRCFVRVEKLDLGPGALGVEIVRVAPAREGRAAPAAPDDTPHPLIVLIGDAEIASPHLPAWLDRIEAEAPAILCTSAPEGGTVQVGMTGPQRRIDLLAIEQNCWRLAARDPRCVVTGTRTEMDWAMRKNRLTVWAPSKLVLDAVEPPSVQPRDTGGLIAWFARAMQARGVLVAGDVEVPTDLPVTRLTDPAA
ncbi:dihydroneopterin aldolase [Palleronia sediminis]|uniref:Dihydroneopterin aldolase n=1 Tax=Palleronia sediminis TaxID=2547833 RepID=A0A4R6AEA1_9RHOB|nr:dihydroneopterin aldolase [Palleronia sediminis]TDL79796.1 dihydroneopterin aldolase [Palleronia sediminis]